MTTITFDTLAYVKKLKEAGCSEQLAEIQAEALHEIVQNNLVTKQDLKEIRNDIALLEKNIILKVGAMLAACVGILSLIITLLDKVH